MPKARDKGTKRKSQHETDDSQSKKRTEHHKVDTCAKFKQPAAKQKSNSTSQKLTVETSVPRICNNEIPLPPPIDDEQYGHVETFLATTAPLQKYQTPGTQEEVKSSIETYLKKLANIKMPDNRTHSGASADSNNTFNRNKTAVPRTKVETITKYKEPAAKRKSNSTSQRLTVEFPAQTICHEDIPLPPPVNDEQYGDVETFLATTTPLQKCQAPSAWKQEEAQSLMEMSFKNLANIKMPDNRTHSGASADSNNTFYRNETAVSQTKVETIAKCEQPAAKQNSNSTFTFEIPEQRYCHHDIPLPPPMDDQEQYGDVETFLATTTPLQKYQTPGTHEEVQSSLEMSLIKLANMMMLRDSDEHVHSNNNFNCNTSAITGSSTRQRHQTFSPLASTSRYNGNYDDEVQIIENPVETIVIHDDEDIAPPTYNNMGYVLDSSTNGFDCLNRSLGSHNCEIVNVDNVTAEYRAVNAVVEQGRNISNIYSPHSDTSDDSVIFVPAITPPSLENTRKDGRIGKCPICLENMCDDSIASTTCGHLFCIKCIQTAIEVSGKKQCPKCRKYMEGVGYYQIFL